MFFKTRLQRIKDFLSFENSDGEQAEASPSEISEELNASPASHSANAEAPEVEAHPRPRGRPRKARLVVMRTAQIIGRRANKRTLAADGAASDPRNQVPVTQQRPYPDHAGYPQVRKTPPRLPA